MSDYDTIASINKRILQDPNTGELVIVNAPKNRKKDDLKLDLSSKPTSGTGLSDKSTVSNIPKEKEEVVPKPRFASDESYVKTDSDALSAFNRRMTESQKSSEPSPAPEKRRIETESPRVMSEPSETLTITSEPASAPEKPTAKLESSIFRDGVEVEVPPKEVITATEPMPVDRAEAPEKPAIDENRMMALFRKTTGTAFDPKSRVDRARMAELTSFIEQDPERLNKSDTKIALDFYRTL